MLMINLTILMYLKVIFFLFFNFLEFCNEKYLTKIRILVDDEEFHSAISINEELALPF